MEYTSLTFIIFLACACLVYYILPKSVRVYWILVINYLFYTYASEDLSLVWVLLSTTALTYVFGIAIGYANKKRKAFRLAMLITPIVLCVSCLLYFKNYFTMFAKLFGNFAKADGVSIIAPLGISYFIFMSVGYLIDIYREKYKPELNFLHLALFTSFFACVYTGPIERGSNILPQIQEYKAFDFYKVSGGMFRILWGMFKKYVIANTLYEAIKTVYSSVDVQSGPMLLLASLAFSYYLYVGFAADCDIGIGAAAMLGFDVMENFKQPLAAHTFSDLWRRWHISLSSWFREYLYFPLGGNRKGKARSVLNQIIVFAVSGLWHGASLGYLVWGLMNGVYLAIGKETAKIREKIGSYNPLYKVKFIRNFFGKIITYLLFTSCIIFFAAEIFAGADQTGLALGAEIYSKLFSGWNVFFSDFASFIAELELLKFTGVFAKVFCGSIFIVEIMEYWQIPVNKLIRKIPFFIRWPLYYAILICLIYFGNFGVSAHVYQNY